MEMIYYEIRFMTFDLVMYMFGLFGFFFSLQFRPTIIIIVVIVWLLCIYYTQLKLYNMWNH